MPLPIATIGLSLAAAGLKIFGPEGKLLEFAAHPLDLLTGHLLAENAEELAAPLRERFRSYERIKNEDLDERRREARARNWAYLPTPKGDKLSRGAWPHRG